MIPRATCSALHCRRAGCVVCDGGAAAGTADAKLHRLVAETQTADAAVLPVVDENSRLCHDGLLGTQQRHRVHAVMIER